MILQILSVINLYVDKQVVNEPCFFPGCVSAILNRQFLVIKGYTKVFGVGCSVDHSCMLRDQYCPPHSNLGFSGDSIPRLFCLHLSVESLFFPFWVQSNPGIGYSAFLATILRTEAYWFLMFLLNIRIPLLEADKLWFLHYIQGIASSCSSFTLLSVKHWDQLVLALIVDFSKKHFGCFSSIWLRILPHVPRCFILLSTAEYKQERND